VGKSIVSLTAKQEMFCKEYLIDLNATQAAIRAGYSEKTAHSIGHENLSKPEIQERLVELNTQRIERVEYNADWVLKEAGDAYSHLKQNDDYTTAKGYLDLVGKHQLVNAFTNKVEVTADSEIVELFKQAAQGHVLPKGEL